MDGAAVVVEGKMACGKQNWSAAETTLLLNILKEEKIVERLDGRKSRNNELFKQVFEKLKEAGINRTIDQIKNRWKGLKSAYYKAKSQNNKSGESPSSFPFYSIMDEIMGGRPLVNAAAHGVEVGFSEEDSLDASNISEDASDVESNFEEAATSSSAQTEEETGEEGTAHNCTLPSAAKKRRKPSSGYAKLMNVWSAEQKSFLDRIEQHQERNQQRDEMLLSRFLEESTRSTERLLGQMFEGLRGLIPQTYEAAPHFQGHAPPHNSYMQPPQQYPGQFYNRPMLYTPNVPNSSGASTSDHNLHDLG